MASKTTYLGLGLAAVIAIAAIVIIAGVATGNLSIKNPDPVENTQAANFGWGCSFSTDLDPAAGDADRITIETPDERIVYDSPGHYTALIDPGSRILIYATELPGGGFLAADTGDTRVLASWIVTHDCSLITIDADTTPAVPASEPRTLSPGLVSNDSAWLEESLTPARSRPRTPAGIRGELCSVDVTVAEHGLTATSPTGVCQSTPNESELDALEDSLNLTAPHPTP